MKTRLIVYVLSALLRALTAEQVKILIDGMLDQAEDMLEDNLLGMQTMGFIRQVIDVPDDISGDED